MEWGNDCLDEIDNQYVHEAFNEKNGHSFQTISVCGR